MQTKSPPNNLTSTPIPQATIEAVQKAMQETGINPLPFLELFSGADALQVFSRCRYVLFQSVYEKYRGESAIGSFKTEMAECSAVLYEMFYDMEEDYLHRGYSPGA